MKNIIPLTISLLLVLGTLFPASAKMQITFATQDFFPFSYVQDNRIEGPGAEIIRTVCARINTDCKITIQPWLRSIRMTRRGKAHGIFMVGKNSEREKWMTFSPAIMVTEYGFFECLEAPIEYKEPKNLIGKTIGVYGPSNTSRQLENLIKEFSSKVSIDLTPDDITQFRKLSRCRVDTVYSNREVGFATIKSINASNIVYTGTDKKILYYIGFSREHTPEEFIHNFNNEIELMKKSGELSLILSKYNMQAAP